jgi:hypothetical protein
VHPTFAGRKTRLLIGGPTFHPGRTFAVEEKSVAAAVTSTREALNWKAVVDEVADALSRPP